MSCVLEQRAQTETNVPESFRCLLLLCQILMIFITKWVFNFFPQWFMKILPDSNTRTTQYQPVVTHKERKQNTSKAAIFPFVACKRIDALSMHFSVNVSGFLPSSTSLHKCSKVATTKHKTKQNYQVSKLFVRCLKQLLNYAYWITESGIRFVFVTSFFNISKSFTIPFL